MKKALIRNSDNVVVNVINVDTGIPAPKEGEPDKRYSPPSGYRLVDIEPGARAGNVYANGKFSESQDQKDKKTAEEAEKRASRPNEVKAEAERRIDSGATINGLVFRTDDMTMIRLRGLIDAFDAGLVPAEGVKYQTRAGKPVEFKDKATAQSFYRAANLYRSAVLEASAKLQATDPIPEDFAQDKHWP